MGASEDAVAAIGAAITVAEHLAGALAGNLPDGDETEVHLGLADVCAAPERLTERLGL
jgi:hypothetical protein